jgi:hypothetical protein
MGGMLSVFSAGTGQGAAFTLELPLAKERPVIGGSIRIMGSESSDLRMAQEPATPAVGGIEQAP